MVYNSKLSGALLVLAFLACLFMVSSAKSIHEQPLHEGGLKKSPNDALEKGIELSYMYKSAPACSYQFRSVPGKSGRDCLAPISKEVSCRIIGSRNEDCPKVSNNNEVKVLFRKSSAEEYEIKITNVHIDGFKDTFVSKVYREKSKGDYTTHVDKTFNRYIVHAIPLAE
eukprot:Nk52_evm1s571 gene=Nk52_evmTU1s571